MADGSDHDNGAAPGSRRPNLLVIGAARSGTTALCNSLGRHPEVFMTEPKEMHFLANASRRTTFRGPGDDLTINRVLVTDPDRYLDLFARSDGARYRAEGSVSTLYHPERAIPAIRANADPDVRLVAMLRDPVDRAYSSYLYLRSQAFEHCRSFEQALALEGARIGGGYHHLWHLRAMSRYRDQLPAFAEAFGSRLLVLVHEEFRRRPEAELERLHRFLDLDRSMPLEPTADTNRGGVPRSKLVVSTMNRVRRVPLARQLARTTTSRSVRDRIRSVILERPPIDPAVEAPLRHEFRPDVEAVEAVLGRAIPDWRRP